MAQQLVMTVSLLLLSCMVGGFDRRLPHIHVHCALIAMLILPPPLATRQDVLTQAEVGGTVTKLIVDNGTPVTPGQSLLVIKP